MNDVKKTFRYLSIFSLMIGLGSSSFSYAQNFYKWVDANGSTHYTKTPPPKGAKKLGAINTINDKPSGYAPYEDAAAHPHPDRETMAARDAARAAAEASIAFQLNNLKQPTAMAGPDKAVAAAERASKVISSKPNTLSPASR